MNENLDLLVVTAKDAKLGDTFSVEDLYRVGTVVKVKQMLKLPKNVVRVMLLGQCRAQLEEISLDEKGIHMAEISQFDTVKDTLSATENKAYLKTVKELLQACWENGILTNETIVTTLKKVRSLETLVDLLTEAVPIAVFKKQEILETADLKVRTEKLLAFLLNEIEIGEIRTDLINKLK